MEKVCPYCGKKFDADYKEKKYCSQICANLDIARIGKEKRLKKWLDTGKLDYGNNTMIKVNSVYRKYIEKEQNHKCAICGISDEWNGKPLTFILDHIDGDSSNHNRNNLRLVCPNCDSQLDTYKFRNSHSSGRTYRTYKNK